MNSIVCTVRRMRVPMQLALTCLSIIILFTGCAGKQLAQTGFLDDYSILETSAEFKGALFYQNPEKPLRQYDRLMIDPVVVQFHADAKGKAIDPEELQELTVKLREEAIEVLSEGYEVVTSPGPRTLRIQSALTDLSGNKAVLNLHPYTKMTGLGLGGASMEAKGTDAQTGDLVYAVVDSRSGDRISLDIKAGLTKWGSAEQVVRYWARRLKEQLDAAHEK